MWSGALSSTLPASPIEIAHAVVRSAEVLPGDHVGVLFSGGARSELLWDLVRVHRDDAVPVFVDTGLYPSEVHDALHRRYAAGGFPLEIRRNDDALRAVADGRMQVHALAPETHALVRQLTAADSVPYSMSEPVVRRLLFDLPMAGVRDSYDVLFSGDRDPTHAYFEREGRAVVVRPLLGLDVNGAGTVPAPFPPDPVEDVVERAMAMAEPARTEYVEERLRALPDITLEEVLGRVRERLVLWKGGDRFGHA